MRISLFAFALSVFAMQPLFADAPVAPRHPYVTSAPGGHFYFKMMPTKMTSAKGEAVRSDGFGIAYQVLEDGSSKEIWRTQGWYSSEVYLDEHGEYLVAMGPTFADGYKPKKEDVAIRFYSRGRLIKEYSTLDLVKDPSKVRRTMSHYFWVARDTLWLASDTRRAGKDDEEINAIPFWSASQTFRLKTCDGVVYFFSASDGSILRSTVN